jgi:hypothetical protein
LKSVIGFFLLSKKKDDNQLQIHYLFVAFLRIKKKPKLSNSFKPSEIVDFDSHIENAIFSTEKFQPSSETA